MNTKAVTNVCWTGLSLFYKSLHYAPCSNKERLSLILIHIQNGHRKVHGIKETFLRPPTAREFRTFWIRAWATSKSFRAFAIPFPRPWPWGIWRGVRIRIWAGTRRVAVGTRGLGIRIRIRCWARTEEKLLVVLWWVEICCPYRLAFLRGGVSLPFPLSSFDRSFSFASKILFAVPILEKEGDVNITWLNET